MRDRFIHIGRLERAVPKRKPGIREAYMKVGKPVTIRGQPFWQVKESDYQALRKEFALPRPPNLNPNPNPSPRAAAARPPQRPGIFSVVRNAAGAAKRVITAAAASQAIHVPDAEFQRRMTLCADCDNYIKETQRCAKCACFLASQVIGKARLATEACPMGKW